MDIAYYEIIRRSVREFTIDVISAYVTDESCTILDIAPQVHEGVAPFVNTSSVVDTLDIDPSSKATYVADLCDVGNGLPEARYDFIFCTEVLEHVLQPFNAVSNIRRLLKPKGLLFITVPFNFRIHGPLPDCWRFTEHGLRAMLGSFEILSLEAIETPERDLMPVHYRVIARKR